MAMTQRSHTMKFTCALGDAPTTAAALAQITTQLQDTLPGQVDLMVVFLSPHHRDHAQLVRDHLREHHTPRALLGVTGEGVIGIGREIESDPGIVVLAASLPGVHFTPISLRTGEWAGALGSPEAWKARLMDVPGQNDKDEQSSSPAQLKAVIMLADPFSTPMLKVLDVMDETFAGVPVVGGLASAVMQPNANRLLLNEQVHSDGLVGVAVHGPVQVDTIVSQGCRPIGKPLVITKAVRNIVMELGGRQALEVIHEVVTTLSEGDRKLVESNGLLVGRVINEYKDRFGRGDFLVRNILGVDRDKGYLAVADPQVRIGQTIQFQLRDQQTAIDDFELLLEAQAIAGDVQGALLFSCNGRGSKLFTTPNTDASLISKMLGAVPLAGFFAGGEFGPVGAHNYVHGHTACLALFRRPA